MLLGEARKLAREWVAERCARRPGYRGAYFAGSSIGLPDDAEWPASSDLDVMVVLDTPPPAKTGKLLRGELILEISEIGAGELERIEHVLETHYLAYNLHRNTVLDSPDSWLAGVQKLAAEGFAREEWVQRRCEAILNNILGDVRAFDSEAPLYRQVIGWVFPVGKLTHVLLAAGLQNCTVRRRYPSLFRLLEPMGLECYYRELLAVLDPRGLGLAELSAHMNNLERLYDLAAHASSGAGGDIGVATRPVSIGGTWELLLGERPRDAIFWMAVTFGRCCGILAEEAPSLYREELPALLAFLEQLGIRDSRDLERKTRELEGFAPRAREMAAQVIRRCPGILR